MTRYSCEYCGFGLPCTCVMGRRATAGRFDLETEETDMGLAENMQDDYQAQADARATEERATRDLLAVEVLACAATLENVYNLADELGYAWLADFANSTRRRIVEEAHKLALSTIRPPTTGA
jgi:hypothetical protein